MKKILFLCLSCCCSIILIAQCIEINQCVTGLSFEDFNCNGINDTEPGVQGVVVKVYDSNNQLAAIDTTDVQGAWQACGLIDANQYRVEFILPENIAAWANPTHTGLDNGSNVQFVTVPTCANFGLSNPSDYCNLNNLRMGTTCFVNGDNNNDKETFVTFDYNAAGPSVNGNLESMATDAQIGAVWGLAYNIPKHRVYVSAVERRHTGYTNNGPGAIFQIDITDPINPVVTHFINISNPGADQHQDLATGGANLIPSRDANSFFNVGKLSIGDIDISNDGNTLWAMNLNTRSLVEIAVPTATEIATYSIPGTLCNDINEVRPWAIKVHKNKVYVGVVCSGENDGDFEAHVLELQDDGTFLVVTTVDLGYPKEEVWTYTGNGCNYVGP